jgi:hypothetical protein
MGGESFGRPMAGDAAFQRVRREWPEDALAQAYLDTRTVVPFFWNLVMFAQHVEGRGLPIDPMTLPTGEALQPHLGTLSASARANDAGLLLDAQSFCGAMPGLAVLVATVEYTEFLQRRMRRERQLDLAAARLRDLFAALRRYRNDQGQLPATLGQLYPRYIDNLNAFVMHNHFPVNAQDNLEVARRHIAGTCAFIYMGEAWGTDEPMLALRPDFYAWHGDTAFAVVDGNGNVEPMLNHTLRRTLREAGYGADGRRIAPRERKPQPEPRRDEPFF